MRLTHETEAELELIIATPASGGAGAPVIIGLHGRGSAPEHLVELGEHFGGSFVHVLPRGPVTSGAGHAWYEAGEQYDEQVAEARRRLLALIGVVRSKLGVGPEMVAVWGFSQGGLMSLEVGLSAPSPVAATISIGGKMHEPSRTRPEVIRRARDRNFFLVHGTQDPVTPYEKSREAYRALAEHGGRVELAELAMAHEITPLAAAAVRGYLASVLKTAPATA